MTDPLKKWLPHSDSDTLIFDDFETTSLTPPGMYDVILLNDDYTPMDFVVNVLVHFFQRNEEDAIDIMWKVHNEGSAICGTYTAEIAESKVSQVNHYARNHDHPLKCDLQKH